MGGLTALGGTWAADTRTDGSRRDRHPPHARMGSSVRSQYENRRGHRLVRSRGRLSPQAGTLDGGGVAILALSAAEKALSEAGLMGSAVLGSGRVGVACGSSFGATEPVRGFRDLHGNGQGRGGLNATSYIRMMSHTTAVNIGIYFGLTGRVITTSSACTSGSQGIGYAYEAVREGHADIMLAGGAEQLCPTMAVVFDTLFATSTRNDSPATASRPYDRARDGLVIGEGRGDPGSRGVGSCARARRGSSCRDCGFCEPTATARTSRSRGRRPR